MNQRLALDVLRELAAHDVREFCICPGARNSPLSAMLLEVPWLRKFYFFEERSAAFFALGRIKSHGKPVAIVTTSGTAAGELLPAAMEAHYTRLPLVMVTADRPRSFRGTGAPQTAEQVGIFGVYSEACFDLAREEKLSLERWRGSQPLHLNICFEEPLLDTSAGPALAEFAQAPIPERAQRVEDIRNNTQSEVDAFLAKTRNPFVLVGSLDTRDRAPVAKFLAELAAPVYLEAHSGLREDPLLAPFRVQISDGLLARAERAGYPIDGVLRIGGIPTLRLWRDLELAGGKIPVLSISREPFSGLSWAAKPHAICPMTVNAPAQPKGTGYLLVDRRVTEELEALFAAEPTSEPALFRALSRAMPEGSRVYLGNSLPIREWDLAAVFESRGFEMAASRGLNGIDGQVSTFLGFAQPHASNWAVLGDLTTMYDLPAPWILPQLENTAAQIVVINNGGGKIFSRMFPYREFQNPHQIEFSGWAKMWNLDYERWTEVPASIESGRRSRVIEVIPDAEATARFWKKAEELWKK